MDVLISTIRRRIYPLLTMAKSTGSPYHAPSSYPRAVASKVAGLSEARLEGRAQAMLLASSRAASARPTPCQRGAERGSKKSGGSIGGNPGRVAGKYTRIYALVSGKLTHPQLIDETVEPELKNRAKTRHASFTMLMSASSFRSPRVSY